MMRAGHAKVQLYLFFLGSQYKYLKSKSIQEKKRKRAFDSKYRNFQKNIVNVSMSGVTHYWHVLGIMQARPCSIAHVSSNRNLLKSLRTANNHTPTSTCCTADELGVCCLRLKSVPRWTNIDKPIEPPDSIFPHFAFNINRKRTESRKQSDVKWKNQSKQNKLRFPTLAVRLDSVAALICAQPFTLLVLSTGNDHAHQAPLGTTAQQGACGYRGNLLHVRGYRRGKGGANCGESRRRRKNTYSDQAHRPSAVCDGHDDFGQGLGQVCPGAGDRGGDGESRGVRGKTRGACALPIDVGSSYRSNSAAADAFQIGMESFMSI